MKTNNTIGFVADVRVRKQDRSGNTYHDVALYNAHGDKVAERVKVYGYGNHYVQTLADMIYYDDVQWGTKDEMVSRPSIDWIYSNILILVHKY